MPLPQSEAARLEFDSKLEQFVIMQAQRDVIRDRSKADYYMKYANGKTSMQLNFRADALYKMICFDRYFTHWQKKHNDTPNLNYGASWKTFVFATLYMQMD